MPAKYTSSKLTKELATYQTPRMKRMHGKTQLYAFGLSFARFQPFYMYFHYNPSMWIIMTLNHTNNISRDPHMAWTIWLYTYVVKYPIGVYYLFNRRNDVENHFSIVTTQNITCFYRHIIWSHLYKCLNRSTYVQHILLLYCVELWIVCTYFINWKFQIFCWHR